MRFGRWGRDTDPVGGFARETMDALWSAQPMAVYGSDRKLQAANSRYLEIFGYDLAEVLDAPHDMFVDDPTGAVHVSLWRDLAEGKSATGDYSRRGKGGREAFLRATYIPVTDRRRALVKIVEIAFDTTSECQLLVDHEMRRAALDRVQGVADYDLDGILLTANPLFCKQMGYELHELVGKHHSMLVEPQEAATEGYRKFWESFRQGRSYAEEFKCIAKGGRVIWLAASYNPVYRPGGEPYKVVKYTTDATAGNDRKFAISMLGTRLARLADGDLTATIEESFAGDLDNVRTAFNDTISKFRSILTRVRSASGQLKTAIGEIMRGTNDLSERTMKQAKSVESTAMTLDHLAETVADNARRAGEASTKAAEVSGTAKEVGTVVSGANDAMERIMASSGKISNVIGLIDDIAFQTNLLALNASVEAARAGDAGRGFAVVAVEVRRLAQSAAQASSEVKVLIEQSASEVRSGSQMVSDATQKVNSMLHGIHANSTLIRDIAIATQNQSVSIAALTEAMRELDEMTQHNSALVQQTNATIEQNESQAVELDRIVDVFVVGKDGSEAKSLPPPSAGHKRYRAA